MKTQRIHSKKVHSIYHYFLFCKLMDIITWCGYVDFHAHSNVRDSSVFFSFIIRIAICIQNALKHISSIYIGHCAVHMMLCFVS